MESICVFCGSNSGNAPEYVELTTQLGEVLAHNRIRLVYGGARVGLMGILADAMVAKGGEIVGVIPKNLVSKEVAHTGINDLRIVDSMHERKALMAELAEAFIALPGGLGTFEEFFEMLTWSQLGLHKKPIGLLNIRNYYSPLLQLIEVGVKEQFIPEEHRKLVLDAEDPETLLKRFSTYKPIEVEKWIKRPLET